MKGKEEKAPTNKFDDAKLQHSKIDAILK